MGGGPNAWTTITRLKPIHIQESLDSRGVVIDRYGNFHLTDIDTDMLIITDAYTDTHKKKTNLPIKRKGT